jgi:O-antigen/teichoic acid export membrane protein
MVPKNYTLLLLLISLSCTFYNINLTILQSFEKIKTFNLFQIIQSLFLVTFIGGSLLYHKINELPFEVDIYLLALLLSYILGFIFSIYPILKHLKSLNPQKNQVGESSDKNRIESFNFKNLLTQLKEMLLLGFWVQLANLAQLLNYRLSYYFIEFYVGRKPLGIFDLGTKLSEAIWVFPKSLCLVQYARLSNNNDEDYARKLTLTFAKIATLFTLIVVILLLLLPPTFFSFIFGAEFSEVKPIIYALAPGIVFLSCLTIISHHFAAKGLYWINGLSSLTGLLVTLVGGFIFIPMAAQTSYMHAITVAGLITSCSYFVSLVFSMLFFFKRTQVSISDFLITHEEISLLQTEVRNLFSNLTKRK